MAPAFPTDVVASYQPWWCSQLFVIFRFGPLSMIWMLSECSDEPGVGSHVADLVAVDQHVGPVPQPLDSIPGDVVDAVADDLQPIRRAKRASMDPDPVPGVPRVVGVGPADLRSLTVTSSEQQGI